MRRSAWRSAALGAACAVLTFGCASTPSEPIQIAGAACASPPVLHCPDADCPGEMQIDGGPVVEPKTGRSYFLDYPCDLKPGEDVTFILSLHGGGSYGNWQRHYFPLLDSIDSHRLVVATPNTPAWSANDDAYLENIVDEVLADLGPQNVASFWLVGHSMGSFNSRRLVCSDYFRDKADGYMSLSGGRVGNPPDAPTPAPFAIPPPNGSDPDAPRRTAGPGAPPPGASGPGGGAGPPGVIARTEAINLDCDFSFIFEGGGNEPSSQALPGRSEWAEKYGCGPRVVTEEVVDERPGYVYDSTRQEFGSDAWGRLPRPGRATIMNYPGCRDGRIVADVTRLDKGHTEGLEPKVTEALIDLMQSARGGKIREAARRRGG